MICFYFKIIVPEDCSPLLCHVIESLLLTHAECKLNRHDHLVRNSRLSSEMNQSSNETNSWYQNLVGRIYKD